MFDQIAALPWHDILGRALRVCVLLGVGLPLLHVLSRLVGRVLKGQVSDQARMLTTKAIVYVGSALLIAMGLQELNFKLGTILGAAGIVGVAVGFASQTSLSNIISGAFLIWEKPFAVGDLIRVGETLGVVAEVDLLSVKLRTLDNTLVRIPNENLLKSQVTNVTHFPIRRIDIAVGVAYKEDVGRVVEVLADVADKNPHCLDEPKPLILFKNFGDSALEFLFGVWCVKTDYLDLKNSIMRDIKERFDQEGIEIPFPHRTLYAGAVSDPFPIRIAQEAPAPEAAAEETSPGKTESPEAREDAAPGR